MMLIYFQRKVADDLAHQGVFCDQNSDFALLLKICQSTPECLLLGEN
jgi:hypothetical protein